MSASAGDRAVKRSVLLVGSSGGHLAQLYRLEPWWSNHERVWVTFDTPDSLSLLQGETVYWAYRPTTRNLVNLVRNLVMAFRVVRRHRPAVVVSTGAAVAFPYFVCARLFGVKTVFVEVFDRITSPTLTGRLCRPLSDRFLLQWEQQRRFYPEGHVIGTLL